MKCKMGSVRLMLPIYLACGLIFHSGQCLEDYELDLYDLVEEVNGTFYQFMDLDQVRGFTGSNVVQWTHPDGTLLYSFIKLKKSRQDIH